MSIFKLFPRSQQQFSKVKKNRSQLKRVLAPFFSALILMFAGNAYAVINVGLAIENDLDINGNISVINGTKVKVAYTVIEDTDRDLDKKDKIQLLRVSDDSIVSSVLRGKKKAGTVSLKVKNSEGEQLYVRYLRKGNAGTEIARISHPADPGYLPLFSIAGASTADLIIGLNALTSTVTRYHVVGINDFVPFRNDYTYFRNDNQLNPTSSGATYFFAPVRLPDGAIVTAVDFYSSDSSSTARVQWNLTERRQTNGLLVRTLANGSGDNAAAPGNENLADSGLSSVVDNSQFYYQMRIFFSNGSEPIFFRAARITYEVSRPD